MMPCACAQVGCAGAKACPRACGLNASTPLTDAVYQGMTLPLGTTALCVALFRQEDGSHALVFCFHHIIFRC